MNSLTCAEVREAAAEYALGILPPPQAAPISLHLLSCPDCRREVEDVCRIGDRLLELVPGTEPPLGFDRKVLARIAPGAPFARRRRRLHTSLLSGAAAAIVAGAVLAAVTLGHGGHRPGRAELAADFLVRGHDIGSVYIGGNPAWISMAVHGAPATGAVTCQLVESDGEVHTVGTFQLVGGSGSWQAPDPPGIQHLAGARLVTSDGTVIATANFVGG